MILAFLVAPVPLLFVSAMLLRSLESVVDLSISASKGLLKKSFPMLGFMEPALAFMQPIFEKLFGSKVHFTLNHVVIFSIVIAGFFVMERIVEAVHSSRQLAAVHSEEGASDKAHQE